MDPKDTYTPDPSRYDSRMQYRRAGRSGVLLSEVSLGFWHNFGTEADFDNCREVVRYAFDQGIISFDLANNYGPPNGCAEEVFGRIFKKDFSAHRSEMFISTKAGHEMWPGPYGDWCSRKNLLSSLDQSLKRMGLDYVDIFYSHRYDPNTPLQETLQALVDAVRSGKALYVGLSKYPKEVAQEAYKYLRDRDTPCLLYQGRYNMLVRNPEKEGLLDQAADAGSGFIAFSPLAQGLLTDKYLSGKVPSDSRMAIGHFLKPDALTPETLQTLRSLEEVAEGRGQKLSEMALAWLLIDEKVTSVIVGARNVAQLSANLKALKSKTFSPEELQTLDSILR